MPRDIIPARVGEKPEIASPIEKHDRDWGDRHVAEPFTPPPANVAHQRDFAQAKERLAGLNYAATVAFIQGMPSGIMELYLLAEEDSQHREEVLRYFPKPGQRARDRYLPAKTVTPRKPRGKAVREGE